MELLTDKAENGKALTWFENPDSVPSMEELRKKYPMSIMRNLDKNSNEEETSHWNQKKVLVKKGFLKARRDTVSIQSLGIGNT